MFSVAEAYRPDPPSPTGVNILSETYTNIDKHYCVHNSFDLRQLPPNIPPQTKLTIPVR